MPERTCPKCGEIGYENHMFVFYHFRCKKCEYEEGNLDTHPLKDSDMTLGEYYGLPDDV